MSIYRRGCKCMKFTIEEKRIQQVSSVAKLVLRPRGGSRMILLIPPQEHIGTKVFRHKWTPSQQYAICIHMCHSQVCWIAFPGR